MGKSLDITADSKCICELAQDIYPDRSQKSYTEALSVISILCYKAVINEKEPALVFCRLFVESWCYYYSLPS